MNKKEFEEAMTAIDDKFIIEAIEASDNKEKLNDIHEKEAKSGRKSGKIIRFISSHYAGVIAACTAVCILGAFVFSENAFSEKTTDMAEIEKIAEYGQTTTTPGFNPETAYGSRDIFYTSDVSEQQKIISEKNQSSNKNSDVKIIYTANISGQTKEYDKAEESLKNAVNEAEGYFQSANIQNASTNYRNGSYVIRVPAENFDALCEKISGICTVTSNYQSSDDISESYYDIKERLESAQAKLDKYQELLTKAENMEDIIKLEAAINSAQYEVDNLTGTLNHMDLQVEYSIINLSLQEVYEETQVRAPKTFGEKLADSFKNGLKAVGDFIENFIMWLAYSWIFVLVVIAIAAGIILIIKKRKNRK